MACAQIEIEEDKDGQAPNAKSTVSARILKKRETDRRYQRKARERRISHITTLETLLDQVRGQDSNGLVDSLLKKLSDTQKERDELAEKLKKIEDLVRTPSSHKPERASKTAPADKIEQQKSKVVQATGDSSEKANSLPTNTSNDPKIDSAPVAPTLQTPVPEAILNHNPPSTNGPACECAVANSTPQSMTRVNKWKYATETLTEWFKWPSRVRTMSALAYYNDDIPIRAVVEGWDSVERKGYMTPSWSLLKGIDRTIFSTCDPRERIAVLQIMSWLLHSHLDPKSLRGSNVPEFYIKRPSEEVRHPYAINYFAWPGLRERFVYSEHRYCSNDFWTLLCRNFRITWPYEIRDCYSYNTSSGLYQISSGFQERIRDIRHWTMGIEFFQYFPELCSDIPTSNSIPLSMSAIPQIAMSGHCESLSPTSDESDHSDDSSQNLLSFNEFPKFSNASNEAAFFAIDPLQEPLPLLDGMASGHNLANPDNPFDCVPFALYDDQNPIDLNSLLTLV